MPGEGKATSAGGEVRRLRAEDAPELVSIVAAAPGAAEWPVETYENFIRSSECLSVAHESEGRVTGFIIARRLGEEAEVLNLAVRPETRKKGIGGILLQAAVEELRHRGVTRVYLEVRESNTQAKSFYQNHGLAVTGVRPKYYREPDEAAIQMEKKLTG